MPGVATVRCTRCHRVLKDPVSISLGIGPECRNGSHRTGAGAVSNGHKHSRSIARPGNDEWLDQYAEPEELSMQFHAVANIYPLLQGVEFESLCNSIKANGLRSPIITLDGKILDGRNRYRACVAVGVEPRFEEYAGDTELLDLLAFVRDVNEERRHLTSGQRAAVAVSATELVNQLSADAMERMKKGKADPVQKVAQGKARDQLAQMFGTNHRYVDDAAKLKESSPRLFEQVLAGNVTLTEAKKGFNYKRDTKAASPQDIYTPQGMDACQTPAYAIDPLLPYLTALKTIWEPACGEGLLVDALQDCAQHKFEVIGSDILEGKNFFDFEPEAWDCLVTNPPYSIKFQWLARCYTFGKPFALLMPVETLGAKTAQELFERYGVEILLLDKRINFKMPKKGWESGGAQFPTAWFTWKLGLPSQVSFGKVSYE